MLAIHNQPGSFSDRWIKYCEEKKVNFKIVNCYDSNIIEQLRGCDGLMWHWSHNDYRDQNFARQLVFSLEKKGVKVFPNYNTCWHFDDKVGQKYLLEVINAPLVPSYVFYDRKSAYEWIEGTDFPKVFKLRGGASSQNVKLIKSKKVAKRLVRRSFDSGFPLIDKKSSLEQRLWVLKRDKDLKAIVHFIKGIIRLVFPKKEFNLLPPQKGYVYFQDFVPDNEYDDRIVVVGDRAFALRRYVRKDDFRASGSGVFTYDPNSFSRKAIEISFNISKELNTQSLAYDFVYDRKNNPKITEISYAYAMGPAYDNCPGYWDEKLNWHKKTVNPQYFMIEDFIKSLGK